MISTSYSPSNFEEGDEEGGDKESNPGQNKQKISKTFSNQFESRIKLQICLDKKHYLEAGNKSKLSTSLTFLDSPSGNLQFLLR